MQLMLFRNSFSLYRAKIQCRRAGITLLGACVLGSVWASPPALAAPPRRPRPSGRVTLTFTDVDVRAVLAKIAEYTHTDIILTPGVSGNISINLRGRTPDESIRLTAASAGLSVATMGNVYIVGPSAEVQKAVSGFAQTEIVPLRYAAPADAAAAVMRIVPTVRAEASKTGVMISGLPADLESARAALRDLEEQAAQAPANRTGTATYTFKNVDPSSGERVLHQVTPDVKMALQDRTLILTGAPADLDTALRTLASVDIEPSKAPETQDVLVYRLKYLNADKAETSLKKALPNMTITVAPEPTAPPAAIFNPLSGGFQNISGAGGVSGASGLGTGAGGSSGAGGTSGGTGTGGGSAGATPQALSRATSLILIGSHTDMETARQLLEQTDVEQPMVRIEAVLVEVNADSSKTLGINWDVSNFGATFTEPAGKDLGFGSLQRSPASFAVTLQAMALQNKARILAAPHISAVDNEDATIFIGDLRRFPGATILSPGVGTVQTIDTIPVGIALLVRPHIHPDGNITLKVHPVVSAVTSIVDSLPQTSSREADTTVRLRQNEELVIGGLFRNETTSSLQKLPILGDIPVIGEFFRSRTKTSIRTEVVLFLRAYPVLTEQAPPHDFRKEHP